MAKEIAVNRRIARDNQVQSFYTRLVLENFGARGLYGTGLYFLAGIGGSENVSTAVPVQRVTNLVFRRLESSPNHTLAIDKKYRLWGWGYNQFGQLGLNDYDTRLTPVLLNDSEKWGEIGCGYNSSYAITLSGVMWVCGRNNSGQLGLNNLTTYNTWQRVTACVNTSGYLHTPLWHSVAGGRYHTIAQNIDGHAYTWGENGDGQLGHNDTLDRLRPTQTTSTAQSVACGENATYIISGGALYSCGQNQYGQQGSTPGTTDIRYFRQVPNSAGRTYRHVAAGMRHMLALSTGDHLFGCGTNSHGQLAPTTETAYTGFTQLDNDEWETVYAGYLHSIGIKHGELAFAWGSNAAGCLGLGTETVSVNKITRIPTVIGDWGVEVPLARVYIVSAGDTFSLMGIRA